MSIICNRYYGTRDFSYNKETRCFVAEASTIAHLSPHDTNVYDDACDMGFIMVSHHTGASMIFIRDGFDTVGDEIPEIAGWRYKASYVNGMRPGEWKKVESDLRALIIND
jgi:hypothetical protein